MKSRCDWVGRNKPHYEHYHDNEWGIPVHDDVKFFEMLILEGAQAGLNWETILKKREGYRAAFNGFDPHFVAAMSDAALTELLENKNIIRNRLKIWSARKNAIAFVSIQSQFGSFDAYVWDFVQGCSIINRPRTIADLSTTSPEAKALSADLKHRGMSFVGPTIIYAFMQATGLVNDHLQNCFCCP